MRPLTMVLPKKLMVMDKLGSSLQHYKNSKSVKDTTEDIKDRLLKS